MAKRVMILAGGTGGHVYPALAVARVLSESGNQVFWMGTRNGLEARVAPANGFPIDWLSVSGFRGKHGLKLIKAPFLLFWACCQAGLILYRQRPDVVLGMGGFVSGPGGLMAWLMRIPMLIHEQNAIPGTTNRVLSSLAKRVLEAFPGTFGQSRHAVCTGNPVRAEIVQINEIHPGISPSGVAARSKSSRRICRDETRECSEKTPCILILGGSQGARRLNQCVPGMIASLNRKIEVYHQSGPAMKEQTEALYRERSIRASVTAFVDNMAQAYQWADLVICRAGAMTISELAIAGLPAILVPFPYAIDDHQTRNAHYLVDARAAVLVPESDSLEHDLTNALNLLLDDPARIRSMGQAAARLAKPDAAKVVAEYCIGAA